jgi:predicted acylesterase/phospholipase RssA
MGRDSTVGAAPPYSQAQFDGEKRYCDVVMKGGITSGVVYPLAVTELATKYRLKNIGGASAGAIAAAVAAAAEHARDQGGFLRMAALPDEISSRLLSLFQPTPELRPLFEMLLATLGKRSPLDKLESLIAAIVRGYPVTVLLGVAPGLAFGLHAASSGNRWDVWLGAVVVLLIGIVLALALRLSRALFVDLPARSYGLCPGLTQPGYATPALTPWLADKIDEVAGRFGPDRKPPRDPLTFGELAGPDEKDPRINLEIMTTNLTAGRPHRIPFDSNVHMFKESEWKDIFPPRVFDYLVRNGKPVEEHPGYRWLPRTPDLPVVVAVRMSLSFPLLLAAVPLYANDYTLLDPNARNVPRRCWFSDGGICSNFPIHFFDSIWPRWPTFGITLESFQPDSHKGRVFLPVGARQGLLRNFTDVESLFGFAGSIIDTMQSWHDNMQSTLPGFRDRIVHVRLDDDEGGLNLDMPAGLVLKLSEYGKTAGEQLRDSFDWDAHRWTRYVISMARIEETLQEMRGAYDKGAPLDEDLARALERFLDAPSRYKQTKPWRDVSKVRTGSLMHEALAWEQPPSLRNDDIPKPEVDLRITPRV